MPTLELQPGEVAIFGYGSLLSLRSFERSFGRPYSRERLTGHLPGWRRVWDCLYPNDEFYFETEAGGRCYPENTVYLNVRRADGAVNGLLYAVTMDVLPDLDRRESSYDRIDITSQLHGVTVSGGPAYVYVGKPEWVRADLRPRECDAIRKTYLDIVEAGLRELGTEFRAVYEASTDEPPPANVIQDRRDEQPVR